MAYIDEQTDKLIFKGIRSEKQKLFIQYYCNPDSDTFDNGTQSYLKAYDGNNENVAAVEAHKLLTKVIIKTSIDNYKVYLHDIVGFQLDWLDINLRNLYYRTKEEKNRRNELAVLKTIGDRIGAFVDTKEDSKGITVPMGPEDEKLCGQIMEQIMARKKRQQIKKA